VQLIVKFDRNSVTSSATLLTRGKMKLGVGNAVVVLVNIVDTEDDDTAEDGVNMEDVASMAAQQNMISLLCPTSILTNLLKMW